MIYHQIVKIGLCVTKMSSLHLRFPRQLTPGHVSATSLTLQPWPLRALSSSSSKSLTSALSPNSHIALSVQAVRSPTLFSSTPASTVISTSCLMYREQLFLYPKIVSGLLLLRLALASRALGLWRASLHVNSFSLLDPRSPLLPTLRYQRNSFICEMFRPWRN